MKIYVVTSGCYSDFHINAMFSTREKAQKYIDAAKFDDWYREINGITEYDIDSAPTEPPKSVYVQGCFKDDELGSINFNGDNDVQWNFAVNAEMYVLFAGNVAVRPGETAEDFRERARKVTIDKYFEWKAKQYG